MKIHDKLEQGTQEWLDVRKLKMTASNARAIGNNGKGLETYIYELVADYYSTGEKEQYTNEHIERGNELEPIARSVYELETGRKVDEVGFIAVGEYSGCSPDGLIEKDGGLEIKCVDDKKYFKMLIDDTDIKDYDWQIQMCLLVSGREWWDLVIYNPNFNKNMIIKRIPPDPVKQEKLKIGLAKGEKMIEELIDKYNKLTTNL
jgi:putative phage-type endonuclease